ncbi:hypothetical protein AMATHDRAFT_64292 [Amanita thiersii Skay4041]|uniref:3'-5' exonuclease domain-containing protein n=1 Tax=Amanita thiersii Skay4041 TaxID=703135 RepID=A0A2A9NMN2_9AGAR|nr:hypothetical protein AMATHDRAFT_64292 [Amanita thiersii Skay4041]
METSNDETAGTSNHVSVASAPAVPKHTPKKRTSRILPDSVKPLYSFKDYIPKSTIVFSRHEEEANDLIGALKKGPVGFDLEWRVLFMRLRGQTIMQSNRVAVVQIADSTGLILVLQIYGMSRFPKKLKELIENPDIPKLGANILNDGQKLFKNYGILAQNLFELGALVHLADPAGGHALTKRRIKFSKDIISLAKLVDRYCERSLDKEKLVRMCNWEDELDEIQIEYAANDAHCALKIYERLLELARQNNIILNEQAMKKRCSCSVPAPYPAGSLRTEIPTAVPLRRDASMQDLTAQPPAPLLQRHHSEMAASPSGVSNSNSGSVAMRPRYLRAYQAWHRGMDLERMCSELSLKSKGYNSARRVPLANKVVDVVANMDTDTLKAGTVIGYIIGALQADPKLPFEMDKLRELVQLDIASWERHRDWIIRAWSEGRGVAS